MDSRTKELPKSAVKDCVIGHKDFAERFVGGFG
jgi:hypothetical protein